jgi:hypothetical protein
MIIVIRREDESVAIMRLLPIAAVRLADGKRFTTPKVVYSDDRKKVQLTLAVDDSPAAIMTVPAAMLDSRDPVDGWQLEFPEPKREIERWRLSLSPQEPRDVSFRSMSCSAIPQDRSFRNAWCDVTPEPAIDIDMDKARAIHKDRLRARRAPMLAKLDIDYQRADEQGAKKQKRDIAARKQALRDVTDDPLVAAATTPEALKNVIPAVLTG